MTPNQVNRAHWPTKENKQILNMFLFFLVHGKNAWDGPKWGREGLFPANPDLADILGDMDSDFDNFHFDIFLDSKFLDFQVPRFPKSGPSRAWARPGLA